MTEIPPPRFGTKNQSPFWSQLRSLRVGGEPTVIPRSKEKQVSHAGQQMGMKFTCRRLGSPDTTTVWRIA